MKRQPDYVPASAETGTDRAMPDIMPDVPGSGHAPGEPCEKCPENPVNYGPQADRGLPMTSSLQAAALALCDACVDALKEVR